MHPSIISVLARLRQDVAEILTPQTIRDACRRTGYSWRGAERGQGGGKGPRKLRGN